MNAKFAVVTGASRGIGFAIAQKLAAEGFSLYLTSRSEEKLQKAKKQLEDLYQVSVNGKAFDLASPSSCLELVEDIKSLDREITILVNNAGKFSQGPLLENQDLAELMQINVFSVHTLCQGLHSHLRQNESHIFNICSVASKDIYPNSGAYCTTKFALYGYTKSLRQELISQGIRVTAILPGATLTDSWAGVEIPEERFVSADAIAQALWGAYQLPITATTEEIVIRPTSGDI